MAPSRTPTLSLSQEILGKAEASERALDSAGPGRSTPQRHLHRRHISRPALTYRQDPAFWTDSSRGRRTHIAHGAYASPISLCALRHPERRRSSNVFSSIILLSHFSR